MKGKILFKEEQTFRNTWMYYLIIGIALVSIIGALIPIWVSGGITESFIGLIIAGIVSAGLIILFSFSKLTTIIDDRAIYYCYPPFVTSEKSLTKDQISKIYVRKYRPIWEYGGWGYRIRPGKGKALNVSGNMGLQIIQNNGKALLIGTNKPKELERAIGKLNENWELNG